MPGLNAGGERGRVWGEGREEGENLGFAYRVSIAHGDRSLRRRTWHSSWNMSRTPFCLSRTAIVQICWMSRNHGELAEISKWNCDTWKINNADSASAVASTRTIILIDNLMTGLNFIFWENNIECYLFIILLLRILYIILLYIYYIDTSLYAYERDYKHCKALFF